MTPLETTYFSEQAYSCNDVMLTTKSELKQMGHVIFFCSQMGIQIGYNVIICCNQDTKGCGLDYPPVSSNMACWEIHHFFNDFPS